MPPTATGERPRVSGNSLAVLALFLRWWRRVLRGIAIVDRHY
jgi:hypothetical protein